MSRVLFRRARLVFWDFDGVIKDSLLVKEKAFSSIFETYGSDLVSRVRKHHRGNGGVSRLEKFPLYLSWAGLPVTPQAISELSSRMEGLVIDGVLTSDWVPGVKNLLQNNPYGQQFVVVSATPLFELIHIIARLGLASCFQSIYGAPISKTEAIARFMSTSRYPPHCCLMIGDSQADYDAAQNNGISFLLRRHSLNFDVFQNYTGPSIIDFKDI